MTSPLPFPGGQASSVPCFQPWPAPSPRGLLLPLMTRSCKGAQALGRSHCSPEFRREVGIPDL